ncbi:alpha/beta fold hydrolase [Streptomyces sp. NPDC058579]|uniref:alpha/beta fold hydrolase n=1 Tax=Streptomyces sp. NPDC058579 TaxID=3346548 RepID=UPI00364B59F6
MRVELSEVTLDVEVSGEGPTVLLVHGFPDSKDLWRHQVPALTAAGYQCVVPTLRGFGSSGRPAEGDGGGFEGYHPAKHVGDLLELLAHLEIDGRVHLVGHDWGSGIVQGFAQIAPERVASLSILSVGHMAAIKDAGFEQKQRSWYMILFQFPGVAEDWLSRDDFANLREMATEHPDAEAIVETLRAPGALTAALNIYRAGVPVEVQFGPALPLPPLPGPVLGVWSTGDRFMTEQSMTGTGKHVDGTWRYERVENAGHWLQLDQPERINTLVLDFLAENPIG